MGVWYKRGVSPPSFFFVSQRGFGYIFPLFFPLDVVNFVGLEEEEALDSLEESTARRLCLLLWKRRGHIRRKAFRFGWLGNRSMRDREEQSAREGRPRVFLPLFILWIDIAVTYIYVHSLKIDAHFFCVFPPFVCSFFFAAAVLLPCRRRKDRVPVGHTFLLFYNTTKKNRALQKLSFFKGRAHDTRRSTSLNDSI